MQSNEYYHSTAKIVGITSLGEDVCAAAARVSTRTGTAMQMLEQAANNSNNRKLIDSVLSSGHLSVMEHLCFNMVFNNVSVFVEQFLIEFRLASFTVQSRRYVDFSNVGFYSDAAVPTKLAKKYNEHMKGLFCSYGELLNQNIPKEDARFVLPYCFYSNFYCTCNARELMHIICSMQYGRGSVFQEIKTIGEQLHMQFEEYFPNLIDKQKNKYIIDMRAAETWFNEKKTAVPNCSPQKVEASVFCIAHSSFNNRDLPQTSQLSAIIDEKSIKRLLVSPRSRELEFINASFLIKDISLSAITHYVRHRMQTVIVPCIGDAVYRGRYIVPNTIAINDQAKRIYADSVHNNAKVFAELLEEGLSPLLAPYFALSGNSLDIVSSMNGRELSHYFRLRLCSRAQWEINGIAKQMLSMCSEIYPHVFSHVGPSCTINGVCPEGEKTCGRIKHRYT